MKDRNPITIHDYDTFMQVDGAVKLKLGNNQGAGASAYQGGDVPQFEGFDTEYFSRSLNISLELSVDSKEVIQRRVVAPLLEIAGENNIKLLAVGESNEEPHITMQTGRYMNGVSADEILHHQDNITNDWRVRRVGEALQGREITLDRLVFDGRGNIFLCASGVVPETQKARDTLKKLLQRSTQTSEGVYSWTKSASDLDSSGVLTVVDFSDITHSGVARIGNRPSSDQLKAWYSATKDLRDAVERDPVSVVVERMYVGTSFDFVNRTAPHLFKNN